jgi:uncharacterized tellurite resistance protein B-like protein
MGLFNIGKLQKAAIGAMNTVSEAAQGAVQSAAKAAEEAKITDRIASVFNNDDGAEQQSELSSVSICVNDALKLFYYLMSADGSLEQGELDVFDSICDEFHKSSAAEKSFITMDCEKQLTARASSISPLVTAMACIDAVLYSPATSINDKIQVSPKLLVWNMLAIAFGDETFDDTERELVTHVARHFNVSEATVMQMEDSMLALADLEREQKWVKTTSRHYLTIETIVNEIDRRKAEVFEGAQALIAL